MKTVSVLGVLHHLHTSLFADTYALEDLAAILRALRPECVLAELPPGWDARHTAETLPDFKMEYREVILPLAEEVGYKELQGHHSIIQNFWRRYERSPYMALRRFGAGRGKLRSAQGGRG